MKKTIVPILLSFFLISCGHTNQKEKNIANNNEYKIILRTEIPKPEIDAKRGEQYTTKVPGEIDPTAIKRLNAPLKALTAFYAAMGGSYCSGDFCNLTTALGLGKQGSEKHKTLIRNYFPQDNVAEMVLQQDCYLRPSGASSFSDFEYLTITDKGDSVFVDYRLLYYDRGETICFEGPDIYLFKDNTYKNIKRNIWTH